MDVKFKNGLLYTTIEITYLGKSCKVENIIIDTGAAHSIISPDVVENLGIAALSDDEFITMYGIGGEQYAYRKKVDCVMMGSCSIDNCNLDFGMIDEDGYINGLLGIDLLIRAGVIIDLNNLTVTERSEE